MTWGVLGFYAKLNQHMAYVIPNVNALMSLSVCYNLKFPTTSQKFFYEIGKKVVANV